MVEGGAKHNIGRGTRTDALRARPDARPLPGRGHPVLRSRFVNEGETMRREWRVWLAILLLSFAAGCGKKHRPEPPAPAPVPAPQPEPQPPAGAAKGLPIPEAGDDGRFETINSGVTAQEALWHVRGALNVAALGCRADAQLLANYNQFLTQRKSTLAAAYTNEASRLRSAGRTALDQHMTRLYNFFAQPPAQVAFCRVASEEAARIVTVAPAQLPAHAVDALGRLEAPFTAFYTAYNLYRRDLAAWQADPTHVPVAMAAAAPPPEAPVARMAMATASPDTAAAGGWRIQIGAFTGRRAAETAWQRAREQAPSLAQYEPHYEAVPGRPELVRLQLGSEDDRAGALRLCAAAAAGGFDCLPMPRR